MLPRLRYATAASVAGFALSHFWTSPSHIYTAERSHETRRGRHSTLQVASSSVEKSWFAFGRTIFGASVEIPADESRALPTDKLTCKRSAHHAGKQYRPVVLLSCGSFNPPTYAHLRMFELAAQELTKAGYDVLGGYMSPVHDAYSKKDLAKAEHRVAMCQLAAETSPLIMVDPWEAAQKQYQYSLHVLQHLERAVNRACSPEATTSAGEGTGGPASTSEPGPSSSAGTSSEVAWIRSMLLCGADMVESLTVPGVWHPEHVRQILQDHGLVCIGRVNADVRRLMADPGSVLHQFQHNIILVEDPIVNEISSTKIRSELCQGHSVRYLLPAAVIDYIQERRLYC